MAKIATPEQLAKRAQELAEALNELQKTKEAAARARKDWKRKADALEERIAVLGAALRLKQEPIEQMELPA
ncbi:MAG: hypothetical protein M0R37_13700 [Bacteroidales bacterium]|jgi:hypothetical protein|nr:hypothetical protein [Bacteroidales bacterium]